jgi:hypothetical protein
MNIMGKEEEEVSRCEKGRPRYEEDLTGYYVVPAIQMKYSTKSTGEQYCRISEEVRGKELSQAGEEKDAVRVRVVGEAIG